MNSLAAVALAAVVAISVAGCTSGKGSSTSSTSASTSGGSSSVTAVAQNSLPPASAIANDVDKRKAITVTKCAASDGGWSAAGTAKNAGTQETTYAITIFFTNDRATVQDYATASVKVKAGETGEWTAAKKFTASNPTNCVLRGVG